MMTTSPFADLRVTEQMSLKFTESMNLSIRILQKRRKVIYSTSRVSIGLDKIRYHPESLLSVTLRCVRSKGQERADSTMLFLIRKVIETQQFDVKDKYSIRGYHPTSSLLHRTRHAQFGEYSILPPSRMRPRAGTPMLPKQFE